MSTLCDETHECSEDWSVSHGDAFQDFTCSEKSLRTRSRATSQQFWLRTHSEHRGRTARFSALRCTTRWTDPTRWCLGEQAPRRAACSRSAEQKKVLLRHLPQWLCCLHPTKHVGAWLSTVVDATAHCSQAGVARTASSSASAASVFPKELASSNGVSP